MKALKCFSVKCFGAFLFLHGTQEVTSSPPFIEEFE
jgi:hypothetical protein